MKKKSEFIFLIVGETTNLMAIDSQKFMDMVLLINIIWSSPLQIALAMYFLWDILGASSLAGMLHPAPRCTEWGVYYCAIREMFEKPLELHHSKKHVFFKVY